MLLRRSPSPPMLEESVIETESTKRGRNGVAFDLCGLRLRLGIGGMLLDHATRTATS